MARKGYEFPRSQIDKGITDWHKKNPNNEDSELEAHHKVPIEHAKKMRLPPSLVKSGANMEILTKEEHKEKRNQTLEESATIAQSLFGLVNTLLDE